MRRLLVLLQLAVLLAVLAPLPPAAAAPPREGRDWRAPREGVVTGLAVLHEWDARRARAWAHSDAESLRRLYLPGSSAARADVRLLRAYADRGLVVRRLVTQVYGIRVLHRTHGRLVLRVWDRVAGGVLVHGGRERPLPSSRPALRTVEVVLRQGQWRVAAVGP